MPSIHILKTEIGYWDDINESRKTFELRRDDREPKFTVGDTLILIRGTESSLDMTASLLTADVCYVLRGIEAVKYGVCDGWCVLGLDNVWEISGSALIEWIYEQRA